MLEGVGNNCFIVLHFFYQKSIDFELIDWWQVICLVLIKDKIMAEAAVEEGTEKKSSKMMIIIYSLVVLLAGSGGAY